MAKTFVAYNDPCTKNLTRIVHSGPDSKPPYQFAVEERKTDAEGVEGWHEARTRMPYEIVLALVLADLVTGNATAKVDPDGTVRIDARKTEIPLG
jgi:hypothetical protein